MMDVVSLCRYLTSIDVQWTDDYWSAFKFVQAVKGMSVNGYATIPTVSGRRRLDSGNTARALDWAAEFAIAYLNKYEWNGTYFVVPIPSSKTTIAKASRGPQHALADLIAKGCESRLEVCDTLRFKEKLEPAHRGGPRDPEFLYPKLALGAPPPKGPVILIDDVRTSGGHLQASAALLRATGVEVDSAIVVGRTTHDTSMPAFGAVHEPLDDWHPRVAQGRRRSR